MNDPDITQHSWRSVLVTGVTILSALDNENIVWVAGKPLVAIDCFGIPSDDRIRCYLELGCEEKGLGRGHIWRIKEELKQDRS